MKIKALTAIFMAALTVLEAQKCYLKKFKNVTNGKFYHNSFQKSEGKNFSQFTCVFNRIVHTEMLTFKLKNYESVAIWFSFAPVNVNQTCSWTCWQKTSFSCFWILLDIYIISKKNLMWPFDWRTFKFCTNGKLGPPWFLRDACLAVFFGITTWLNHFCQFWCVKSWIQMLARVGN